MRPHGSLRELEKRRRRIIGLLRKDRSLHEIARRLGCHASSVLRWRDESRRGGSAALKAQPAPGRPPLLTVKQKRELVALLSEEAVSQGYRTEPWTTQRVAVLIKR